MTIKHKKTAGPARQSDPAIIDGPDWDDNHLYGAGALFPFAFVTVNYYPSGNNLYVNGSRVTGSSIGSGQIHFTLDMTGLPVSEASNFSAKAICQQLSLNSNLQWQTSIGINGYCDISFIQSGSSALPSAPFWAQLLILVEVLPE